MLLNVIQIEQVYRLQRFKHVQRKKRTFSRQLIWRFLQYYYLQFRETVSLRRFGGLQIKRQTATRSSESLRPVTT
jgi:hypothetical protein